MKKQILLSLLAPLLLLGCSMGRAPSEAGDAKSHSEHLVVVTSVEQFEQVTSKSEGLVLVDFWATWCPPCKFMNPILAELAESEAGAVTVVKVDVDQNRALAEKYKIESIPTLFLFKGGKAVDMKVGALPKADLLEWLAPHRG